MKYELHPFSKPPFFYDEEALKILHLTYQSSQSLLKRYNYIGIVFEFLYRRYHTIKILTGLTSVHIVPAIITIFFRSSERDNFFFFFFFLKKNENPG